MDRRLGALLLVACVAALAASATSAPPGPPTTRHVTLTVGEVPCGEGGVPPCLAYNGQVPGPTLDVNLGDTLVVTLVNGHDRPVSWHVHGTALAAEQDGIAAHAGTKLVESVAPPGGSFTYATRAAFEGDWHYHDHVLGPDGAEGVERGLFGGLVVRAGGEPRADHVFDLHLLDATAHGHGLPNGGRAFEKSVPVGASFELLVVALGDVVWRDVALLDPAGAPVGSVTVGPGMSERLRVDAARAGTYRVEGPGGPLGTVSAG